MAPSMANVSLIHPRVCISFNKNMNYNGIFVNGNPLDYIVPVFMLQVILSVTISRAIHLILRPLKQPKLVCNILVRIFLIPSVLGVSNLFYLKEIFATKHTLVLGNVSNMATTLFLFLVYIKADTDKLFRNVKKTWRIGLPCMMSPFLFTLSFTSFLDYFFPGLFKHKTDYSIQLGIISSLSYFIVIAHALDELNLLCSELGQLSTSVTMLSEIVSFTLLMLGTAKKQKNKQDKFFAFFSLCMLMSFAIFVIRPVLLWIIDRTPKGKPVKESYVVAVVLCTFLMSVTTNTIGATSGGAAIIMGFLVPDGPPLGATIIQKCELITMEFFMPYFFVHIGFNTDLGAIQDMKELAVIGAIIVVGYLGRLLGSLMFSSYFNITKASAILLSLILSLQGMVELIHINKLRKDESLTGILARIPQVIDDQNFSTLVMSMVIFNAIITPLVQIFYKPETEIFDLPKTGKLYFRSLGMNASIGELRIITCLKDEENVPSIINLLKALNPKEVSPICAYVIHLVPLATQTVPTLDSYKNHKRMFSKPNVSDNVMRAFLNYADCSSRRGPVQIQPYTIVSPYKYMHQPICRLAETTRVPLIIVPFFKSNDVHSSNGTLRIFNTNIQASAKCTVGILVDRGLRTRTSLTSSSYNVAVIFIGGADDREALAFAARMSCHPNVAITVLRLHLRGKYTWESKALRELDESMFRDFKAMNDTNACVVCNDLVVHDNEEVMNALLSIRNTYDLVVVGKRQGIPELEDRLMSWAQYRELGVIGDAIASPDFCHGMMSVLVLQHHGERRLEDRLKDVHNT